MNRNRHNRNIRKNRRRQQLRRLILTVALGTPSIGYAQMPTGADVVAGQAAVSQAGNALNVDAATSRAIVNWDSFSVGAGNVANFNLPDANSAILNRVTSANMPSTIAGAVNSNGHVYLVNPSGIVVSSSGMVNTNGFTASTFDVANQDFMDGGALAFTDSGSIGSIVNNGMIATGEGGAHLIANDIVNNGTITSTGGSITLSGGGSVTLENGVTYVQPTMETLANGISATAGLIQNTGTIRATGAATSGGEVYLVNPNGKILHDGTIEANVAGSFREPSASIEIVANGSRSEPATLGGHVQLEADDITLAAGSAIDASGTNGGGDVLVGGDWQGSGDISQATSVTLEAGATIDASATESGDGGKIVLWSDITDANSITKAFGTLIAKAGELFGDGGQIETSGATVDTDGIAVNAGAPNGKGGLWLIDPYDFTIDATAATNIVNTLNTGTSVEVTTTTDNSGYGSSGNIADNGDITVASDIITGAMSGDATLTLKAARHIVVNAGTGIDATQNGNASKLNVKLWADIDNSGDGINIVSSPTIATNGGALTFGNGNTATIGGVSTQVGGDLYVNGLTAQLFDTAGGDITVNGETILANTNGVTFDSGGGDILFAGVLNSGNQYTYVDGPDGQANSWDWARNDAKNGTAGGAALGDSYMVTITSRLENAIAGIAAGYRGAWIGAYRDTSTPNNWLWADGPEAAQHFFTQAGSGGTALSGSYSNFGANEPNGSGTGGETRGQFFGTAGQWNDLGPSTTFSASQDSVYSVLGYVRETNLAPTALIVNAGTGSVIIEGGVGGSKALSSLDITSSAIAINGNSLITTGAQNYSSALDVTSTLGLTVDGSTLTTGGALDFAATGDIDIDASIVAPGAISIAGNNITLVEDIDNSSASGADILLKASDTLIVGASGVDLEAGTGDVTLRANTFSWGSLNPTINTSGTLAVLPSTDSSSFTHTAVKTSWFNLNGTLGGLQIGHAANTSGITVNSAESVAGPISLYGDDITIEADLSTSGVAGADILLKASGDVIVSANFNLITNTGDVTLWSDSDANNDGYVSLDSDSSIVTGGGDIVIGGGADSGLDGIPDGAATGQALLSDGGVFYSGISLYKATLNARSGGTLDANAGNITLNGTSTYTGGDRAVGLLLHSTKLVGDVVDVTGSVTHTGGTTTRYGVSSNGGLTPDNTNIQAYGGITLTGNAATPADQYSIRWGTNHEMSTIDGDIAINSNGQLQYLSSQTLTLADTRSLIFNSDYDAEWRNIIAGDGGLIKQGSGTLELTRQNTYVGATTISDGHLIIRNDAPSITTSQFNGTGKLTVESDASSFSSPLAFNASINGLSEVIVGKSTNTAEITFAEDITASGPITVYGGTLDFTGSVAAGSNNITFVGNDLQLADTVSSTGALRIETQTSGTSIGVGNITGTMTIDNAEVANLQNGFSSITIGNSAAGDLVVGGITTLVDDLTLQAGTSSDLYVNDELSWSSDDALTLAAGQDIFVNSHINVTGSTAALNLYYGGTDGSSAPTSNTNYYIDVANRRHIRFDEVTAGLKIGNESFTLLDSVSALQGMAVSGRYALAGDLSLAGTTYTDAFYTSSFAGKLDGLGNEVDGLTVRASAGGNYGLFGQLNGGAVRHLGVTNIDILGQSTSNAAANDLRIGGIVGNASGSGTNLLDGVWSTGVIATKQGSQQDVFYAGGLVGGHDSGTLQIVRSFSTVNVSSQGSHSGKMALGGLLGDTGDYNGISGIGGSAQNLLIDRSYSTGSIVEGTYDGYYGSGGLVGVIFGDAATLTDSFSRSNVVGGISSGGIAGYSLPGTTKTYQRLYTTLDRFGNGTSPTQSYKSDTLDAATNNGTQLPSGWSSDIWTAGEFPTLKAVGVPASLLYVQVISGTGVYGDLATPTYEIVDADGNTVAFGAGDYSNLDGVTGTGRYTLGQFTNAGTYNSVSYLSGLGLTGDDASLYALNPFTTAGSYTITPRSITAVLSATGVNKVYDGDVNAGSGYSPTWSFTNIVSGDSATLNTGTSFFNDADVLDANLFTINSLSLAGITSSNGALVSDYALANTTASVAANITAKAIVINGLFANDKIYDGNVTGTIDASSVTYSGLVGTDSVSLSGLGGTFVDKNVGTGKTVTVVGSFTGTDASNYSTTLPTTLTADITPKSVSVSGITVDSRVYDQTTNATIDLSGVDFTGIITNDSLTASGTTGTFADKNAGSSKTVTLSGTTYGGTDVGNYNFTDQATTTADITPKSIIVSGLVADDRIYDQTTDATVDHSNADFDGMFTNDILTASGTTGQFADKNVADDKAVTLSGTVYGGIDVNNYTFTDQTSSTADITPKSITVGGITAADRIYDGDTTATVDHSVVNFDGMINGDSLTATNTTGSFDNKNVGNSKTVTLSGTTYGGTDLNNYDITDQASTTADITHKAIIVSGLVANDRIYDGETDATVDHSNIAFSGKIENDILTASATTGQFADKNVGEDKAVTLSGTIYGGTDVGNYTFTDQSASIADITAKSLSVSGLVANDRIYDSTTEATVDHSNVSFDGMVTNDNLTALGTSGLFADKNVGTTKAVTLSGTTYGGTDIGNYVIADQTASTADITPFSVIIAGVTADDKVYDSNTSATLSGIATVNAFVGDEILIDTTYIASFADANVGDDQSIAVSGFALSGSDATNYTLAQPTGLTADITSAPLTITANNDSKFVTKLDAAGYAGATFDGFVGSEGISDLAGSLDITRVGTEEAAGIYSSALNANGLTSTNYDIAFVRGDYTIIPAEQFLIRFDNSESTYGVPVGFTFLSAEYMDAGFNVATLTPTVNGNDYSFSDGVGGTALFTIGLDGATLSSSGHASARTYDLTMGDLIASGGNFSNDINLLGTHTINRANLTVGAGGVSKTYDGTELMSNLTLNITGFVAGDTVNINGQGSYADRNVGTGLNYTVANLTLSGADANNYVLPGGTALSDTNGVINTKTVTINAPTVTKVYDGNTNLDATATQLNDWTTSLGIAGDTVDGITLTYDDKNVGIGKTLTPSSILINDGNGGANYDITFNTDTSSSITRLSSVTWIGGPNGDWNDPANWAGGAVPDLANVANVIIPAGVTPTFDANVAGPVELESFSGGSLQLDGGTLDVFGLFDADTLTQDGGTLETGDLNVTDFAQNGGSVQVDNDFTVTNTFSQSTSGTIDFGGNADITHTGGTLSVNNLSSGNVKLDSTAGGVHLNNLQSTGTLTIDATGDVTQDNAGTLSVAGTTSITTDADIRLGGPNNDFVGPVSLDATDITLHDRTGGLVLGNIATTGSLDVQTTSGDITQSSSSQIIVGTTSTLTADGEINLTSKNNQFTGPVNLNADNAEITQAIGDLVLGTVNVVDQFWTDVLAGNLNQTNNGTLTVGGATTLNARGPIELSGTGNDFQGTVTVNAPLFNVQSATPPTIIRTGAALADEVGMAANSETINDTIIRPATPTNGSIGVITRVIEFITNLVNNPSVSTPTNALNTVDIQQTGDDTFIRPKRGS